ncbi:MAG: TIGR01777 family oxidoreductase [Acidobacteriota bacterium]
MNIALTGGSGFIGRPLARRLLADGHSLHLLGRNWPPESLADAEAIVNLAGEPVAQRWTRAAKQRIRASRVEGTRRLVAALPRCPAVLVSASAVGIYGSRGAEVLTESSPPGEGFLAEVCGEWERAAAAAEPLGLRVVSLRIGVVLGRGGGALARMLPAFRMGAGGRLGSGRQWMSWIHLDDLVELIRFAILEPALSGPVNATAPNPVTNREFTRELAAALHRPAIFPVPALALKALFGEMASILLDSQRALPQAALAAGFLFQYPELAPALRLITGPGPGPAGRCGRWPW